MFSIFCNIKSLLFSPNNNKRKFSETSFHITKTQRYQNGSFGCAELKENRFKYKDTNNTLLNLNKRRKIQLENSNNSNKCSITSSKSNIVTLSAKGDETKYLDASDSLNDSSSTNSPSDDQSVYFDCQLSSTTMKESKQDLLNDDYLDKILQPSIHEDNREREKARLELESKSNMEQLRKQEKSYMHDLTDKLRQLWSYTPVIFPRYIRKKRLPEITDDMLEEVNLLKSINHGSEIIVRAFNLEVNVADLCSLGSMQWLTDNVINFYLELIYDRSQNNSKLPKVQILSSFFYPKLFNTGYSGVRRWTKKRPIFNCSLLLIPIHLGNHWCFVSVDFDNKEVLYYDSLHSVDYQCLKLIKEFLIQDSEDKLSKKFEVEDWTFKQNFEGPRQMNGYDCGVFLCQSAEYTSRKAELDFEQENMEYFRQKMSYEIITKTLL